MSAVVQGVVKLADFGVAAKLDEERDKQSVVGTPYWMAPEVVQMTGLSAASDIWSVGALAIELLTGSPPYGDLHPMSALYKIVQVTKASALLYLIAASVIAYRQIGCGSAAMRLAAMLSCRACCRVGGSHIAGVGAAGIDVPEVPADYCPELHFTHTALCCNGRMMALPCRQTFRLTCATSWRHASRRTPAGALEHMICWHTGGCSTTGPHCAHPGPAQRASRPEAFALTRT